MMDALELTFVFLQILAFVLYDPLHIPSPKKDDLDAARDIPMTHMGDSILLHLPSKTG